MSLKIIISSAVELKEKDCIKEALMELEKQHSIMIDDLYDCAEHATTWGLKSKQEGINKKILSADWFICLIPEHTVGEKTWEELKLVLENHKKGLQTVVSVFHPIGIPEVQINAPVPEGKVTFDYIKQQAKKIHGNLDDHYWVSYKYNNIEDLCKQFKNEYIKLYYEDQVFRTQRLNGLAKPGSEINAKDIYFDTARAESLNGFIEDKYFPRKSVDGKLQEAIEEQCKFIILLGAPGAGKTRALYQLLADPQQLALGNSKTYALGALANKNIIVINQNNIEQVLKFLDEENRYLDSDKPLNKYVLVCDQIKNVFSMLPNKEKLYRFFDLVTQLEHVSMIATSIPSAFNNLCARWSEYGRKPLEDDQLTRTITIPLISSDDEAVEMRNWMQNELQGDSEAETIGDYIPSLNNYKQEIVRRIYRNIDKIPYLAEILSAIQITETFRRDTALFLPVLITRKKIYPQGAPSSWKEFKLNIIKTLNFLMANNVIWIQAPDKKNATPRIVKKLNEKAFSLHYGIDKDNDFIFDNELFSDTPLSTAYTYGVNEIVWSKLEQEDANRHMGQEEDTLLYDFQETDDVVRAAKQFYYVFPSIVSARRILPRIPHTDCYDDATRNLSKFVYDICNEIEPQESEQEEFLTTMGMLIGRANDISQIKEFTSIIEKKSLKPNYNTIGELYSVGLRIDEDNEEQIANIINDLRNRYMLHDESFFSMSRKITYLNMSFKDAIKVVKGSNYSINTKNGYVAMSLADAAQAINKKDLEYFNLERLIYILAKKCESVEQWIELMELYRQLNCKLRRSSINQYFSTVVDQNKSQIQKAYEEERDDLMKSHLLTITENFDDVIAEEDKETCYFSAINASWNFKQAYPIYMLYLERFKNDNQRLISTMLRTVRNVEFQRALNFLIATDERLKARGSKLNDICYNNLIRCAPNMGEALAVVPYIKNLQDHTLANILNILKTKRRVKDESAKTGYRQDDKIFYYAYSAVMPEIFFKLRRSPYVIGLLYELAMTHKHERFIREIFLEHLSESELRETIDYSAGITSIRIQKNYRTLEEVWQVFNTCRNYYRDRNMYVGSEIYNNLMRKIQFLCDTDELLERQQNKLRDIIEEDYCRIIRDEHFLSALYRFFPEKKIFDKEGSISKEFVKDVMSFGVSNNKVFNNIMRDIGKMGFDFMWKFYEFMVKYYQENGKRKMMKPDIRTVTYLMEEADTKEQFEKAEKAARLWCFEATLQSNRIFKDAYSQRKNELSYDIQKRDKEQNALKEQNKRDYKQRTENIIAKALKDIYLYDILTAAQFNRYLNEICNITYDINQDQYITFDIAKRCKSGVYRNVLTNLIDKYRSKINFDVISYTYLIKLSPRDWDVKRWIKELKEKEDEYKYNLIICGQISQSIEVCRADIDTALDYYYFWEDIMHDIGYDPADPTSFSETTQISEYNGVDDYDGYWLTRASHSIREMNHYWYQLNKTNGYVDKQALLFVKQQMEHFEKYSVPFPEFRVKQQYVDFKKEIEKQQLLGNCEESDKNSSTL